MMYNHQQCILHGAILSGLKFETALSRLEDLVQKLEQGDLSLEESLKAFEEGVRLSKNCAKTLNDAERRVSLLIEPKEGENTIETCDLPDLGPDETQEAPE
jgi:exodeoxyribonuclease VII small subunit